MENILSSFTYKFCAYTKFQTWLFRLQNTLHLYVQNKQRSRKKHEKWAKSLQITSIIWRDFLKRTSTCCILTHTNTHTHTHIYIYIHTYINRVSQEYCMRLRESIPFVKVYRYNPKHLYPKINGYRDNGQRILKFDSCYTIIDYQIHIKTGRNKKFL